MIDNKTVFDWIDNIIINDLEDEIVAFCFNLYEDEDKTWSMELIGAGDFDTDDDDWACDEITDFDTRENPFTWEENVEWEDALQKMKACLADYLINGGKASLLKSRRGVGLGFVDGDIEILYAK